MISNQDKALLKTPHSGGLGWYEGRNEAILTENHNTISQFVSPILDQNPTSKQQNQPQGFSP
jgi:hypothetical protein